MRQNLILRAFQALTGVLLGLAIVVWVLRAPDSDPNVGQDSYFLPMALSVPTFELISHRGDLVHSADFGRRLRAVFFGYTSCPDICPLTLSHLARALEELGEERDQIQVLFITVDPGRDTPERMRTYLEAFDPSFLGLTGSEEEIRAVARSFGADFQRNGAGDSYSVDHSARTFILTPSGDVPLTFPLSATPDEMVRDLSRLLKEIR